MKEGEGKCLENMIEDSRLNVITLLIGRERKQSPG